MVKIVGAALCGLALSATAADIAFNTPVRWGTVRSNNVTASFIVDSSLINSKMQLTLTEIVDGKERVVSKKNIMLKDVNTELDFPLKRPVPGGTDYHSLKWEVNELEGSIRPFGVAPVSNSIDPKAVNAVKANSEISPKTYSTVPDLAPFTVGGNEISLAWNPNALSLIVKGTGNVEISLDPSNTKGSFLAYANRTIAVDFEKNSVEYYFSTRKITKTGIEYEKNNWNGDMSNSIEDGVAVITLPWYEIGAKPFAGRQMGIMINSGDELYPKSAIEMTPATWGNFILK